MPEGANICCICLSNLLTVHSLWTMKLQLCDIFAHVKAACLFSSFLPQNIYKTFTYMRLIIDIYFFEYLTLFYKVWFSASETVSMSSSVPAARSRMIFIHIQQTRLSKATYSHSCADGCGCKVLISTLGAA